LLRSFNYTIVNQTSYFAPIKRTGIVTGGILTLAHTNVQAGLNNSNSFFGIYNDRTEVADLTTFNLSFLAARSFGKSERTSLGIQIERLEGRTYAESQESLGYIGGVIDHTERWNRDLVKRTRLTVGLTRDFTEGKKLGIYYRHGIASYKNSVDPTSALYTPFVNKATHDAEIGVRWRSPLTNRLFYGLNGVILFENISARDTYRPGGREFVYLDRDSSTRVVFGAGVGYAIRPQTTIAFDVSGGLFRLRYSPGAVGLGNSDFIDRDRKRFLTLHAGGQTDIGRRFFVNGSFFWSGDWNWQYPDNYFYSMRDVLNFGPGWRITRSLNAQYIFSKSSVSRTNSHSMMLRYNFGSVDQ